MKRTFRLFALTFGIATTASTTIGAPIQVREPCQYSCMNSSGQITHYQHNTTQAECCQGLCPAGTTQVGIRAWGYTPRICRLDIE